MGSFTSISSHLCQAKPSQRTSHTCQFPLKKSIECERVGPTHMMRYNRMESAHLIFTLLHEVANYNQPVIFKTSVVVFWPEVGAAIMLQTFKQQSPLTHCMGGMRPNMQPRPTEWSAGPTASNVFLLSERFSFRVLSEVSPPGAFFSPHPN